MMSVQIMDATSTAENSKQRHVILPLAPLSFFAMTLGFAETGTAWRWASSSIGTPAIIGETLQGFALLTCAWWLVLYTNKWINYRVQAKAELSDPIQASFLALLPESLLLSALAASPYSHEVAILLFWIGSFLNVGYAVFRLSRFWINDRTSAQVTPSMHLVYTASVLVNSLAAAHFGYTEYAAALFGMGGISWLILDSVLTGHLFTTGLDAKFRNFMGIYMAPSAVAFVAYQALTGENANHIVVYGLLGYAAFTGATILAAYSWLREQPFAPGYWAYTFGFATIAQGLLMLHQVERSLWSYVASIFVLGLASVLIVYVMYKTVLAVAAGKYYPKP